MQMHLFFWLDLCFIMSKKKNHTSWLTKSVDIQRCKRIKREAESVLGTCKTDISKIGWHDVIIGTIRVDTETKHVISNIVDTKLKRKPLYIHVQGKSLFLRGKKAEGGTFNVLPWLFLIIKPSVSSLSSVYQTIFIDSHLELLQEKYKVWGLQLRRKKLLIMSWFSKLVTLYEGCTETSLENFFVEIKLQIIKVCRCTLKVHWLHPQYVSVCSRHL